MYTYCYIYKSFLQIELIYCFNKKYNKFSCTVYFSSDHILHLSPGIVQDPVRDFSIRTLSLKKFQTCSFIKKR